MFIFNSISSLFSSSPFSPSIFFLHPDGQSLIIVISLLIKTTILAPNLWNFSSFNF